GAGDGPVRPGEWSGARESLPPSVPVMVTGTLSPSDKVSSTATRLNFTIRSGTPLPSWSPITVGAAGSTDTVLFRRIDEIPTSLATNGDGGSRKPVIHRPCDVRLRVLGVTSNLIAI